MVILPLILFGGLMGLYTVILVDFVPWFCWGLALSYANVPKYTGLRKGLEYMRFLFFVLFIVRYHLRSTFSTR